METARRWRNIVDEERTGGAAIVRARNAAKGFLSGRVPDLEFNGNLVVPDCNHAGTEFDTNGEIVDWLEALVCELEQETRLADACVFVCLD